MPIREYRCPSCNLLDELIVHSSTESPATKKCSRCGADSALLQFPTSIALARSGMDNSPLDNLIGKDAERRWARHNETQQVRDEVRQKHNTVGLSATGPETYVPLAPERKALRTEVTKAVERDGFHNKDASQIPVKQ